MITNVATIAYASLRGTLRDRTARFFFLVLPFAVTVLVGLVLGGFSGGERVGVLDRGAPDVVAAIAADPRLDVVTYEDDQALTLGVQRADVALGVVIHPPGAAVGMTTLIDPSRPYPASARTALVAASAPALADRVVPGIDLVSERSGVTTSVAGGDRRAVPSGFDYAAPANLVLFMFVNSLGASAGIVLLRNTGVTRRMLSTANPPSVVVAGHALGALAIVGFQAAVIIAVGRLVFGVGWGNVAVVGSTVVLFALLSAFAAVLAGTFFRRPQGAIALSPPIGIAMGMLGGCMWPLDIVPSALRTVGRVTPHAWAVDALSHAAAGSGVDSVIGPLAVLAAFTVALAVVSIPRFTRVSTR